MSSEASSTARKSTGCSSRGRCRANAKNCARSGCSVRQRPQSHQRVADGRVRGVLLEHHRPADDDRKRVVELVGYTRQQGAQCRHLLALMQRLALPVQLGSGLAPARDVAQVGGEQAAIVEANIGDRQLDRQQPPPASPPPPRSAGRAHAARRCAGSAASRHHGQRAGAWDDQVGQVAPEHVGARVAKCQLGAPIELEDTAASSMVMMQSRAASIMAAFSAYCACASARWARPLPKTLSTAANHGRHTLGTEIVCSASPRLCAWTR